MNERDHDLLADIFAEDVVHHFHRGREEYSGIDGFRAYLDGFYGGFPDGTITTERMVAEGDLVAVRYTGVGTREGEFRSVPPTGETVRLSGMRIVRIGDEKIAEVWGQRDDLGQLVQVGAVEPPGG